MKIIDPSFEIIDSINGDEVLKKIEKIGRVCYKSEDKITDESATKFVANIIKRGHESVLEHYSFSVKFICSRAISHEIVRHRIASFSQESQRYCNYNKDKYNNEITFIYPEFVDNSREQRYRWMQSLKEAENKYFKLLEEGCKPEEAREVLPNSTKTEIAMSCNLREWRHFLKLRTSPAAHPEMRRLTIPLLKELQKLIPIVFDDL